MTELASPETVARPAARRRLVLVWQHPATRRFVRVGQLDELVSGRFAFSYDAGTRTAGFDRLAESPSIDSTYLSDRLPAFFGNRVMDRGRGGYAEYRGWLGLDVGTDTPFEVLVLTGVLLRQSELIGELLDRRTGALPLREDGGPDPTHGRRTGGDPRVDDDRALLAEWTDPLSLLVTVLGEVDQV